MAKVTEMLTDHAVADPYSYFTGLREAASVHRDERLGAWLVLRYDDVRAAFRDSRLSSDRVSPYFERRRARGDTGREHATYEVLTRWIVFTDPPRHTRLRKLVEYAFRPRAVERMRGWIASLVGELVEDLGPEREIDFIERFAGPLPVRVICDLFGVPHDNRRDLTRWVGGHPHPGVRRHAQRGPPRAGRARPARVLGVPARRDRGAPRAPGRGPGE